MRLHTVIVSVLCCNGLFADEPPIPTPLPVTPQPIVVFPTPSPPTPEPKPVPLPEPALPITVLNPDELYVVESQIELILLKHGKGKVNILETTGPKTFHTKFVYGNGTYEIKEFTYPYLYIITASKPGLAGIDFIPSGVTKETESKIVRKILSIPTSPQPPPDPNIDPEPEPIPPDPPEPESVTVDHVHVTVVSDTLNMPPATATVLSGLSTWTAFTKAGNSYRTYDIRTTETKGKQAITDSQTANVKYPSMTIRDKDTDTLLLVCTLPVSTSDLKKIINTYLKVPL